MKELYDPKLKLAAKEIREILERHDVSAFVALTSPSHSEFVFHLPTWSGVQPEPNADGSLNLRIRIKKEDQKKAEVTTWMVAGTMELLDRGLQQYGMVLDVLRQNALIVLPGNRQPTPHKPEMDPKS